MTKREEQDNLIARIEGDKVDADGREDDPVPASAGARRTLGAQITIRLEPQFAERLRAMAHVRGVGYTTLARELLEEQLSDDENPWTPTERQALDRLIDKKIEGRLRLGNAFRLGASEGHGRDNW